MDIKKQEFEICTYNSKMTEMDVGTLAKVMQLGKDEEFEAVLLLWFKQKQEEGVSITGPIIRLKLGSCTNKLTMHKVTKDPCRCSLLLGLSMFRPDRFYPNVVYLGGCRSYMYTVQVYVHI